LEQRGPYACSVAEGCAAARTEMCVHPSALHSLWGQSDAPTLAVVRAFLDAAPTVPSSSPPPLRPTMSEGRSVAAAAVLLAACVLLSVALLRRAMRAGAIAYAPLDTTTT